MNVLDLPFEALVFDYASFGIPTVVNNLWTWVALITTAISFWRLRAAGGEAASGVSVESEPPSPVCVDRDAEESQPVRETSLPESAAELPVHSFSFDFGDEGRATKGKFVVYYEDDGGRNGNGDVDGGLTAVGAGEWGYNNGFDDECGEWWERWETVLSMRTGDLEWYRHQDLTAINGNVIRLWKGVRRASTKSGCGAWRLDGLDV